VGRPLTRRDIEVLEPLLLTSYGDILRRNREKASPERPSALVNTGREPVLLHTLHYDITSCQRVFDALKPLALDFTTEEESWPGPAGTRKDV
jgi:hypothetical protein